MLIVKHTQFTVIQEVSNKIDSLSKSMDYTLNTANQSENNGALRKFLHHQNKNSLVIPLQQPWKSIAQRQTYILYNADKRHIKLA